MITGIIAEYNPFHNGHLYQIKKIRELQGKDTPIIACISGGLSQRGELPVLDKWQRARLAVENGVNLVIELPAIFVCRSAQHFAFGGVSLLNSLGIVDQLAFSTPYPDSTVLEAAAKVDIQDYKDALTELMKDGCSYASATAQIISQESHIPLDILKDPNTILGIEYLRAINKISANLQPLTIKRVGTNHTEQGINEGYASGTAIRTHLTSGDLSDIQSTVPTNTFNMLSDKGRSVDLAKLYPALQLKLLTSSPEKLRDIYSINEGLEYKLMDAVSAPSLEEFINNLIGKRYQRTRINRLIIHLLLDITQEAVTCADKAGATYARILAFDKTGRELIKQIKITSSIPLITKVTQHINRRDYINKNFADPVSKMLYYDLLTSQLAELCYNNHQLDKDFTISPFLNG